MWIQLTFDELSLGQLWDVQLMLNFRTFALELMRLGPAWSSHGSERGSIPCQAAGTAQAFTEDSPLFLGAQWARQDDAEGGKSWAQKWVPINMPLFCSTIGERSLKIFVDSVFFSFIQLKDVITTSKILLNRKVLWVLINYFVLFHQNLFAVFYEMIVQAHFQWLWGNMFHWYPCRKISF